MRCPACAAEAAEQHKFCPECGQSLAAPAGASTAEPADAPNDHVTDEGMDAPADEAPDDVTDEGERFHDDTDAASIDDVPAGASTNETGDTVDVADAGTRADGGADGGADTEEIDETAASTEEVAVVGLAPPTPITEQMAAAGPAPTITEQYPVVEVPTAPAYSVFDGSDDIAQFPEPREPFRLRVIFLLSVFAAAAMLMTIVADVIDIRTTRPTAGIDTGSRLLDDLGSNLGLAGFVGAAVLVIGSLLSCFGLRWGAGLAGGAGLALVGWAGLSIGLAEMPIAVAESITRTSTSPEPFTLRVTRDIGWWLIVGLGTIGLIVFLASLRWIGAGRRVALNPMIAALTAVAIVVLGFGPLVPVGTASFADNFRSTDPLLDLPAVFFAGRLGQVGLIVLTGVVGMLIVRSYGLGLAVGGLSVSVWLWVSSFAEIGPRPVGIADRNPGAESTIPHAVTTVGMVTSLVLLLIAAVMATWRLTRSR